MKKNVFNLLLALMLGLGSVSYAGSAAAVTKDGSDFQNRARIGIGNYPGAISFLAIPATAQIAITVGMAVKTNTDSSVWFNTVSPTGSAGDQGYVGIATNTAAAGETVWVAQSGIVPVRFTASQTTTAGTMYAPTTAGAVTPTTTITGSTNTARAISIGFVIESKIVGPDGLARVWLTR